MSGKKLFIIIVSAGVLIALAIVALRKNTLPVPSDVSNAAPASSTSQDQSVSGENAATSQPVNQTQPQKKFPDDYKLSVPDQVLSMGNSSEKLRIFNVHIDASGFTPSEIVVNQGDTLQVNLTAGAAPIDINSYELHAYLWTPAGQTTSESILLPKSGVFPMACKNNCPQGINAALTLAVLPK